MRSIINKIGKKGIFLVLFLFFLSHSPFMMLAQSRASYSNTESDYGPEFKIENDRVYIINLAGASKFEVYTLVGNKIADYLLNPSVKEFTLKIPKGYYIIKMGTLVRKITIK